MYLFMYTGYFPALLFAVFRSFYFAAEPSLLSCKFFLITPQSLGIWDMNSIAVYVEVMKPYVYTCQASRIGFWYEFFFYAQRYVVFT